MTEFAAAFREIVVPDMRQLIRATAPCVAMCVMRWTEAHASIMHAASKRGASLLPDNVYDDFEDWVCTQLLNAIATWEAAPRNAKAATAAREQWQ